MATTKPKAVFKDGAVRCKKCGVEIWEDTSCDCGIDGAEHEGLKEAYEEKAKIDIKDYEVWTVEDEAVYRPLRRKKLRIEARERKDLGGRFKRYGARKRKSP